MHLLLHQLQTSLLLLLPFPKGHLKPIYWKNDYVLITKPVFWIFIGRRKRRYEKLSFSLLFLVSERSASKRIITHLENKSWSWQMRNHILPPTYFHTTKSTKIALPFSKHLMPNYLKVVVDSSSKEKFAMYEQKSALKCILSTTNNVEKRGCALARGHPGGSVGPLDPPYVFLQNPMISRVINIRWVAEKKHKDGVTNHTTISGSL